jgi:hypothetical protein
LAPAAVGTIAHLIPDLFPLFTPGKRPPAGGAGFLRQVSFADHFGHRLQDGAGDAARQDAEIASWQFSGLFNEINEF